MGGVEVVAVVLVVVVPFGRGVGNAEMVKVVMKVVVVGFARAWMCCDVL